MFTLEWAGKYNLTSFDDTKKIDRLFWKYNVETVKWVDDNVIDVIDEELYTFFNIIQYIENGKEMNQFLSAGIPENRVVIE